MVKCRITAPSVAHIYSFVQSLLLYHSIELMLPIALKRTGARSQKPISAISFDSFI